VQDLGKIIHESKKSEIQFDHQTVFGHKFMMSLKFDAASLARRALLEMLKFASPAFFSISGPLGRFSINSPTRLNSTEAAALIIARKA